MIALVVEEMLFGDLRARGGLPLYREVACVTKEQIRTQDHHGSPQIFMFDVRNSGLWFISQS